MANVSLIEQPKGVFRRLAFRYSKRRFGLVAQPAQAAAHHAGVLAAMGTLETAVGLGWRKLDPKLAGLALQLSATRIGCSWCVDYGYYELVNRGTDPSKLRAVPNWRGSDVFDERERAVLEYAESATATPVSVSEDLVERLHRYFSDGEIVELASWVALENWRSRFNGGLGLRSQGFSDSCEVPPLTVGQHA